MADDYEYEEFNSPVRATNSSVEDSRRYDFDYEEEEEEYPGGRNSNHRRSNQDEEEEEEQHPHHRGHSNGPGEDEDDEQQQQKLNGKIEILQQRIDQLEIEVMGERQQKVELQQKFEAELQLAHKQLEQQAKAKNDPPPSSAPSTSEIQQLQNELKKWKNKCETLQEKLDLALITNPSANAPSTVGGSLVPAPIQEELLKYCEKYSLFHDLQSKGTLSVTDSLKIFHSITMQLKKAKGKDLSRVNTAKSESKTMEEDDHTTSSSKQDGLQSYHQHHRLNDKIKALEEELKLAANHADDIEHLKSRVMQLSDRIRTEKEYKRNFELECLALKRKLDMLSDHIEKLVLHIKREGAAKVKFAEQTRVLEKDNGKLREKYDGLYRKMSAKDRLIFELREGSRVLEDQLKLMDEKYLELRNKLDYARYISGKKIKKAEKLASDLRVKFAMTGSIQPLDSLPLPSSASYYSGGYDGMSVGDSTYDGQYESYPQTASVFSARSKVPRGQSRLQLQTDASTTGGGDGIPTMTTSNTFKSSKSAMSIDDVLEKIRVQNQGSKNDWTEEKVRKLVSNK